MNGGLALFLLLIGATGVMRLVEVAVSARRAAERRDAVVAEAWLFPLMVLLHVGVIVLPVAEVVLLERSLHPWLAAGAGTVLFGATALRVWTLRSIGRAWNVRVVKA